MPRLRSLVLAVLVAFFTGASVAAQAPPSSAELPAERVLYVAPGQSLPALVRELYPDQPEQWDGIRRWILENNPHARAEDEPAALRGDVQIRLPQPSTFAREQASGDDEGGAELRFGGRYLFVDPSQSLKELVPKVYPDESERWDQIIDAIMERNSEVFASTGADTPIGRGTRLSIPEVAAEAKQEQEPEPARRVGQVVSVSGQLTAVDAAGRRRVLATGNPVRLDDTVRTGSRAAAVIEMRDGERLTLRNDSEVRIREWRLPETGPGERVIEIVTGGLRAVTGAIGNRGADDYRTITPEATIGIRGTRYAVRVCGSGDCQAEEEQKTLPAGVYIGVDRGRVSVLNQGGEAEFGANEFGYVADRTRAPERAGERVAGVVYTAEERRQFGDEGSDSSDSGQGGSAWLWGLGGLVLLGLAL